MKGHLLAASAVLALLPATATAAAPELSISDRLDDRRYVAVGERAYVVGTEAGRFPAMGFHTRGEMGGFWSPPIKLLDGLWFAVDGTFLPDASRFTSAPGHVRMEFPRTEGIDVTRTDVALDDRRGVLVRLSLSNAGSTARTVRLATEAHSELMSVYPWGETTPSQLVYNLQDQAAARNGVLVFSERGTPPVPNAETHDWAAAVGSALTPARILTGGDRRGPQGDVICPASGPGLPPPPRLCDDTVYGKGIGGRLEHRVRIGAGRSVDLWFGVAGSEAGSAAAVAELGRMLQDPDGTLNAKLAEREALHERTKLSLPADRRLEQAIDWSKQNLADSRQTVEDLEVRETNAGKNYPAPAGELERVRFVGAGFPDYPWLFATDAEYTAFASVALGQFEPIIDHMKGLQAASLITNGTSGKVIHELITEGSVYFGSLNDAGNTDETAKFPSMLALLWRWTGDEGLLDDHYAFAVSNMDFIFRELDEDGDGWPEGLGNVERPGMGEEKLDNTVYTIRGLYDLADMAEARGDEATRTRSLERARSLESRFVPEWWMPEIPAFADSLQTPDQPENDKIQQRHWIGVTPMEAELTKDGLAVPGIPPREIGAPALALRETRCYSDQYGMFHTGAPGCDPAESTVPAERTTFTLNTAIIAVGEGNYGRVGATQQQRYTTANARVQLEPDEQPGAMPEISPSPDYGRSIERPFNERAMVLQAWGAYGTAWPVVHQHLGVRPDLGRGRLEVVPQPPTRTAISGSQIRLGDTGEVDVRAQRTSTGVHTTAVTLRGTALTSLRVGAVLPAGSSVTSARLDGAVVPFTTRETNRGLEVTVAVPPSGSHTVVVRRG